MCYDFRDMMTDITLEFSLNYKVEHSTLSGTHVEVMEETMEEVTRVTSHR
jgi:hypothetical protein